MTHISNIDTPHCVRQFAICATILVLCDSQKNGTLKIRASQIANCRTQKKKSHTKEKVAHKTVLERRDGDKDNDKDKDKDSQYSHQRLVRTGKDSHKKGRPMRAVPSMLYTNLYFFIIPLTARINLSCIVRFME
jgi:hypothetical protein